MQPDFGGHTLLKGGGSLTSPNTVNAPNAHQQFHPSQSPNTSNQPYLPPQMILQLLPQAAPPYFPPQQLPQSVAQQAAMIPHLIDPSHQRATTGLSSSQLFTGGPQSWFMGQQMPSQQEFRSDNRTTHASEFRRTLDRLQYPPFIMMPPPFKRKRYVVESWTSQNYSIAKNTFRKNNDNFIYTTDNRALVAPGPRRTYCKEMGYVCAYDRTTEEKMSRTISVGESIQICEEYIGWIRKKLRLRPDIDSTSKVINIIGRVDLPEQQSIEIDLFDFYTFISSVFSHWRIVFDPEIAPLICICRVNDKFSKQTKRNEEKESTLTNRTLKKRRKISSTRDSARDAERPCKSESFEGDVIFDKTFELKAESKEKKRRGSDEQMSNEVKLQKESESKLPPDSPLEILARWMIAEERRALTAADMASTGNAITNETEMMDLQATIDPSCPLYQHLPGWMKCVIIISAQKIIIHRAENDSDLDTAWLNFFPLVRRFLMRLDLRESSNHTVLFSTPNTPHLNLAKSPMVSPWAKPEQLGSPGYQSVRPSMLEAINFNAIQRPPMQNIPRLMSTCLPNSAIPQQQSATINRQEPRGLILPTHRPMTTDRPQMRTTQL